ncbi:MULTISPECIES: threonine aldolase family protein [Anaerococcus]|uniref:threonine aldolase family protein n=1 Tax=Anaerococcus TaxID=165779 RepID=UPI002911892D|nr:aminotransferase class I/II-fold pyridoxal phosphate-dependent enzyme [Anaerococcus vaginalis]MDU6546685.1 aminotransferase class I/II-fold pyridoxal phosphate-dependent enzyme [Anaerococcus vaginalis]
MINFRNDYSDICYPEILDYIKENLDQINPGYGVDDHSKNAEKLIKEKLEDENVDIYFIHGGTGANILGASVGMLPQESIISATTGHIEDQEAGAIEACGIKIETIPTKDGKITKKLLEEKYKSFTNEHHTVPRKVYISNTTEVGTLYSKKDLEEIYDFCKKHDLYLFMDGARLAHAMANEKSDLKFKDLTKLCDIFYFGGTKNGLMFGEVLVIVNDNLKKNFRNLQKQKGAMLAKGFVTGIMFERLFQDDLYIKGAKKAYKMAEKLAKGFEEKGYKLAYEFNSNQVFVEISKEDIKKWEEFAYFEVGEKREYKFVARFVTTYKSKEKEIEEFLERI